MEKMRSLLNLAGGIAQRLIPLIGREDLDDVEKIKRLAQWCADVNASQKNAVYKMIYIRQEDWEAQQQKPRNFHEVIRTWIKKLGAAPTPFTLAQQHPYKLPPLPFDTLRTADGRGENIRMMLWKMPSPTLQLYLGQSK